EDHDQVTIGIGPKGGVEEVLSRDPEVEVLRNRPVRRVDLNEPDARPPIVPRRDAPVGEREPEATVRPHRVLDPIVGRIESGPRAKLRRAWRDRRRPDYEILLIHQYEARWNAGDGV